MTVLESVALSASSNELAVKAIQHLYRHTWHEYKAHFASGYNKLNYLLELVGFPRGISSGDSLHLKDAALLAFDIRSPHHRHQHST